MPRPCEKSSVSRLALSVAGVNSVEAGVSINNAVAPVTDHMHERIDCLVRRVVGRNMGLREQEPPLRHPLSAHPTGQHRAARFACRLRHRFRRFRTGDAGDRCMQHHDRVHLTGLQQRLGGGAVLLGRRLSLRTIGLPIRCAAVAVLRSDSTVASPIAARRPSLPMSVSTAIAAMARPLATMPSRSPRRSLIRERFHRREQLIETGHPQHAGAADRGIVDGVGTAPDRPRTRRAGPRTCDRP